MVLRTISQNTSNVHSPLSNPLIVRFGTGLRTEKKVPNFPGPADKGINLKTSVILLYYRLTDYFRLERDQNMYSEKRRPKKRELMTVWDQVLT